MPRARIQGRLIRIPVPPHIAYDLTYCYPPSKDTELLSEQAAKLYKSGRGELADTFVNALRGKKALTLKQRLLLLSLSYPKDLRLKVMKQQIEACSASSARWGTAFRRDPEAAYKAEAEAVKKAEAELQSIEDGVSKLEAVLCG